MNFSVLYYVVLGAVDDESYKLKFDTQAAAYEYAAEHSGDVYPVVDVKVKTVINTSRGLRVLDVEVDEDVEDVEDYW